MLASVIIPTYNRPDIILRALDSLRHQTLPTTSYEVIVVDDSSTYDEKIITSNSYPFILRYLRQVKQGATRARNLGAQHSQGDVLLFMDDDVTVSPEALEVLSNTCLEQARIVALGTLISRSHQDSSPFTRWALESENRVTRTNTDEFVSPTDCNTQLLAVRREAFLAIGMLQDPSGGWPNWDDVDFGYRAHLQGFRLLRCARAIGEHWDYSLAELNVACQRWQRAGRSAVRLFQTHPGIRPHLPMFFDKTPISWREDAPRLITRKLARRIASSRPVLGAMERAAHILEESHPSPILLGPLYRWIVGGYLYCGLQAGLHEYGSIEK